MSISTFDLFKVGIGPSSSHTVGPMQAARMFARSLDEEGKLAQCHRVTTELFGSLGATGAGHGSPKAIILGLQGEAPDTVDIDRIEARISEAREVGTISLMGTHAISFSYRDDVIMHRTETLPFHSNGMRFTAYDDQGGPVHTRVYYSVGGGFVVDESASEGDVIVDDPTPVRYPFSSAEELLAQCREYGLSISSLMLANEQAWRTEAEVREGLLALWKVMDACIDRGCRTEGIMPGGLKVKRRAAQLYRQLKTQGDSLGDESLNTMDWVTLYALAVNEENAVGGRIVTAPTNGAAGIIPAVLEVLLCITAAAPATRTSAAFYSRQVQSVFCIRSTHPSQAQRWAVREKWALPVPWRPEHSLMRWAAPPPKSKMPPKLPWSTIWA